MAAGPRSSSTCAHNSRLEWLTLEGLEPFCWEMLGDSSACLPHSCPTFQQMLGGSARYTSKLHQPGTPKGYELFCNLHDMTVCYELRCIIGEQSPQSQRSNKTWGLKPSFCCDPVRLSGLLAWPHRASSLKYPRRPEGVTTAQLLRGSHTEFTGVRSLCAPLPKRTTQRIHNKRLPKETPVRGF